MTRRFKWTATIAGLLLLAVVQSGCSVSNVASRWKNDAVLVNGVDNEWQEVPPFYDEKKQVAPTAATDRQGAAAAGARGAECPAAAKIFQYSRRKMRWRYG